MGCKDCDDATEKAIADLAEVIRTALADHVEGLSDVAGVDATVDKGGFPGALYVISKSVIATGGAPEQLLFSLDPAAAVDIFVHYRDPVTGTNNTPAGQEVFRLYAVQRLMKFLVDQVTASTLPPTFFRALAVRDLPCDRFELGINTGSVAGGTQLFYDVTIVGWAKEPTGIGPVPATTLVAGQPAPTRFFGIPVSGVAQLTGQAFNLTGDYINPYTPGSTNTFASVNVLLDAYYNTTPVTLTSGQISRLECDVNANLKTREQYQPVAEDNTNGVIATVEKPLNATTYVASAYNLITKSNADFIKGAAGTLYKLFITNDNAAAQYYALVNKATAPITGDAPVMYFKVPAGTTFVLEFRFGKRFATGIAWAQVTAIAATITLAGTNDTVATAEFA